jgi:hypothetical protein
LRRAGRPLSLSRPEDERHDHAKRKRTRELTSISSNSAVSSSDSEPSSLSTESALFLVALALTSRSCGSLTLFRPRVPLSSICGSLTLFRPIVPPPPPSEVPFQLSNRDESLLWATVPRHSVVPGSKDWTGEATPGGERGASFCFAVPSPPSLVSLSSAASSSRKLASCLMVASDGSWTRGGTTRNLDRRYHSSGTQNWSRRVADVWNGLEACGVSFKREALAVVGTRDDSVDAALESASRRGWEYGLTLFSVVQPCFFNHIVQITASRDRKRLCQAELVHSLSQNILDRRGAAQISAPGELVVNFWHTQEGQGNDEKWVEGDQSNGRSV